MKHLLIVLLITFIKSLAFAASDDILLVYVDKKTEKILGEFLIDISHYSTFLKKVSKYKPRYIILKFFFDIRKEGDTSLISTLKK